MSMYRVIVFQSDGREQVWDGLPFNVAEAMRDAWEEHYRSHEWWFDGIQNRWFYSGLMSDGRWVEVRINES